MNLLGIDVGTTGCKVALFSLQGEMLASAYSEYDFQSPQPGWAQLDSAAIWEAVKTAIRSVSSRRRRGRDFSCFGFLPGRGDRARFRGSTDSGAIPA